jgi:hypothetical protein
MAQYYLSITSFYLGNSVSKYLTDKNYRITAQTKEQLSNNFWNNYAKVYNEYKTTNRLLFRCKVIKDNSVLIKQIWNSKKDRDLFSKEVNEEHFDQHSNLIPIREFYYIDLNDVNKLIDLILLEKKKVLQHVSKELQRPGMVIGDIIKGDVLIHIK